MTDYHMQTQVQELGTEGQAARIPFHVHSSDALGVHYLYCLQSTPITALFWYQILQPYLLLSLPEFMLLYNMSIYFNIFLPLENNKVNIASIISHIT